MSESAGRAVFLSYASQDAEVALRICEALRAAGIEVWLDQSELVGGDEWDAKIRKQIKECVLFLPIISANTQARREGYFRIEWKLAAQRTHAIADGTPFLVPIVIDATRDAAALVPEEFRAVQWTRLPAGETNPTFCARLKKLLADEAEMEPARMRSAQSHDEATSSKKPPLNRTWLVPMIAGVMVAAMAVALWQPWRRDAPVHASSPTNLAASAPTAANSNSAEVARLRAHFNPDQWQKGDFEALSPTLDRLIQTDPENFEAWALRSITNSLQVTRNIDSGTKPLELGKAAAERALRLAPDSPLAELALGLHLVAMTSRGGDPQACRPHIARAVAALPPDPLTRFADLVGVWMGYNLAETESKAKAWLAAEPTASYPAWILAQYYMAKRRPDEAEKWADAAATDRNITGTRALFTSFESKYYLRADLPAAREALNRVPVGGRTVHRVVHARWLVAMAEQRWDEALQELTRVPEPMLYDRTYHGPRSLLAGLAHQRAGRTDPAVVQFREAERLLRLELASDTDNEELHLVLAVTLACAGRGPEARSEIALVEPLLNGRSPSVYWGAPAILIAQVYGELGEFSQMAQWLRKLFIETNGFPLTPASLRLDARFAGKLDAPEIQTLLKEFAALDKPQRQASAVASEKKSIAVLTFNNLGADKDME